LPHAYNPRRSVARDLPLSLLVHGGLVAVVLSTRFDTPPIVATRSTVVWLTVHEVEAPVRETDVTVEQAHEAPPDASRSAPVPARRSIATRSPEAAPPERADTPAPATVPPRPAIDWERERRAALNELLVGGERRYSTFSVDDFIAPAVPAREHAPTGEIFSPNTNGPSLLAQGEQRTRFGRKLVDICHALTGGFGVSLQGHRLFNLCAAPGGRSDLFAAIKPDYLKLLPDCTTDLPREAMAAIPPLLVRCRWVEADGESAARGRE